MKNITGLLRCPTCGKGLKKRGNILVCQKKHSFDINEIPILLTGELGWKKKEIEEQNEMSHKYTSHRESLLFSLFVNARWNHEILSGVKQNPKNALDAGCGTGMLMQSIQKKFSRAKVYGFDLSPGMAATASRKNPGNIICADIENIPFQKSAFDLVTCRGVLHHLQNEKKALRELRRVLKKDSTLIISDTNNSSSLLRLFRTTVRKHRGFMPEEMKKLIEASGFKVDSIKYFGFLTFPFALPDIFPFFRKSRQEWLIRLLTRLDKKIEKNRKLQKLCFHAIYTCTAC